ncbi:hypothetical protein [Bacillus sp. SD088]|uniref:hypothetical protein n=1 Tax=Bacillus sp. SD088 TaxID=2782012 RepID=UPI001A970AF7|nr:hypothetical protein [Bacillus sp. SD088]MBO0992026.1 hypothetical protein [Bacillus sp. SD088]
METTKLIMVEGIPGSGKSTTAQSISKSLDRMGFKHKWWYEEEQGHPAWVRWLHQQNRRSMRRKWTSHFN